MPRALICSFVNRTVRILNSLIRFAFCCERAEEKGFCREYLNTTTLSPCGGHPPSLCLSLSLSFWLSSRKLIAATLSHGARPLFSGYLIFVAAVRNFKSLLHEMFNVILSDRGQAPVSLFYFHGWRIAG